MITSYISIDLETTGLNPKLDKIIEIGAVKVRDNVEQESFSAFINPGRKLESYTIELTGITQNQLENALSIEEVLPKFIIFLEDLPWVGHQILFDYAFLKKAAVNQGFVLDKEAVDTLRISRCYLGELEHKTLGYLCNYYQIPLKAHRALEDAYAASRLYQCLVKDFYQENYQENNKLFQPQKLNYSVKRDSPATKAQKERLYQLLNRHNLTIEYDIERLTRSEASRYADKILLKYGR